MVLIVAQVFASHFTLSLERRGTVVAKTCATLYRLAKGVCDVPNISAFALGTSTLLLPNGECVYQCNDQYPWPVGGRLHHQYQDIASIETLELLAE